MKKDNIKNSQIIFHQAYKEFTQKISDARKKILKLRFALDKRNAEKKIDSIRRDIHK